LKGKNMVIEVNDSNFDVEVKNSKDAVLVEFGATWCGPCKKQLPILESFSEKHNNVKVVKVDVDQSPNISKQYGIRSVPTVMVIVDGNVRSSRTGLTDLQKLESMLTEG